MSTATLEVPAAELPDMTSAFASAMTDLQAKENGAEPAQKEVAAKQPEVVKEPVKEPTAKEVKPEPVKEPVKKRSAMDAALADDAPVVEPVDDVAQLLEAKDPNWAKARETLKRQSEELKTYKEKISKAGELPPEISTRLKTTEEKAAALEKENAKLRDSIIALDVRFDPATQEKIQARDSKTSKLASELKQAGADADAFEEAMALPIAKRGKHLDAILESIESTRTRANIERKLAEIEVMDEQLDEQMNAPHKSFEEIKRQRQLEQDERVREVEAFKQSTFDKVRRDLPRISKLMREVPPDVEDADEYNADLKNDLEKAPSLLSVAPEEAAVLAFQASRYKSLEKIITKANKRINELEGVVSRYEGSEPGFRGNGKPKTGADYEVPLVDAFQKAMDAQRGV